jgi:hypothetical protein
LRLDCLNFIIRNIIGTYWFANLLIGIFKNEDKWFIKYSWCNFVYNFKGSLHELEIRGHCPSFAPWNNYWLVQPNKLFLKSVHFMVVWRYVFNICGITFFGQFFRFFIILQKYMRAQLLNFRWYFGQQKFALLRIKQLDMFLEVFVSHLGFIKAITLNRFTSLAIWDLIEIWWLNNFCFSRFWWVVWTHLCDSGTDLFWLVLEIHCRYLNAK